MKYRTLRSSAIAVLSNYAERDREVIAERTSNKLNIPLAFVSSLDTSSPTVKTQ